MDNRQTIYWRSFRAGAALAALTATLVALAAVEARIGPTGILAGIGLALAYGAGAAFTIYHYGVRS